MKPQLKYRLQPSFSVEYPSLTLLFNFKSKKSSSFLSFGILSIPFYYFIAKIFANKSSHYVASWYRQPGGSCEELQLFRDQLVHIRIKHKGNKLPSDHVLGDYNIKDIAWPDRINKSGSLLSQSEGHRLVDVMNDMV